MEEKRARARTLATRTFPLRTDIAVYIHEVPSSEPLRCGHCRGEPSSRCDDGGAVPSTATIERQLIIRTIYGLKGREVSMEDRATSSAINGRKLAPRGFLGSVDEKRNSPASSHFDPK